MPALDEPGADRPPLGIRLMHALGKEPDWESITAEQLAVLRATEDRKRKSRPARLITGFPARGLPSNGANFYLAAASCPFGSTDPHTTVRVIYPS